MRYKEFIEEYFMVDLPETGKLVPFRFANKVVQDKEYALLCRDYDIDNNFAGLREIILKARREGFTTFILALFAADMILSKNPLRSLEISYKNDATKQHFRRFKIFIESYCAKKGYDYNEFVETDNNYEIILRHNRASFFVGTASAKTGERGGTVQNLLFSEIAFYPDTEIMTAREIIEASMRMVDIHSGKIFCETTANGVGNYFHRMWLNALDGRSRFKPRFWGWKEHYTEEEYKLIASEMTDSIMLKQEYPDSWQEAFISSGSPFFDAESLERIRKECRQAPLMGELTGHRPVLLEKVNV